MDLKIGDLIALKANPSRIFMVLEVYETIEIKVNEIAIDLTTYSNPSHFQKVS